MVTTLYDPATMYDLLRYFGLSDDLLYSVMIIAVVCQIRRRPYGRQRFFGVLWGVDVMIKKSRGA